MVSLRNVKGKDYEWIILGLSKSGSTLNKKIRRQPTLSEYCKSSTPIYTYIYILHWVRKGPAWISSQYYLLSQRSRNAFTLCFFFNDFWIFFSRSSPWLPKQTTRAASTEVFPWTTVNGSRERVADEVTLQSMSSLTALYIKWLLCYCNWRSWHDLW